MNRISFKEDDISKRPAIELLKKLGYQYISPDEALAMRGGKYSNVLLEEVLRRQLRELNSIRIGSRKEARFSEQNIENGVIAMRNVPMEGGYLSGNEAVYNMLTLGKAFEQSIDGDKKSYTMRYIDWENPKNNVYHVTQEFAVTRTGLSDTYRPDIVLFVNGIPLVVIECKRPDVKGAQEQAISQHLRNQKDDGIRGLYVYSSLLLAIGNDFGSYGTTGSAAQFWGKWCEMFINQEKESEYRQQLSYIINKDSNEERAITSQDEYIYSLCRPERLLELTYHFTLFDAGIKKLARYQQYFAVKEITERVRHIETGKRNGGVVWHTQGSGKSLTMVMLAQKIATAVQNPRIILVTDRTDLDAQITKTFRKCGKDVENATTGKNLVELLQSNTDSVITTIINKFATAIKKIKQPLTDPNIFVLIDEAHRSQYNEMAIQMDRVLPNACKIAFTGTPLTRKDKDTARTFGGIIKPVYTIKQAVEDHAVVPLLYEGRIVPQFVTEGPIDSFFNRVCEDLTEEQSVDLKKKFSRTDILNQTEQRIYSIAMDISEHFSNRWQNEAYKAKAMLVTPKKRVAILYKKYLDEIGKVTSEVLITEPDSREGEETAYGKTPEEVKAFWKKMMDEHGTSKKYQENLINRFKSDDAPEIMIVVDKLTTGFDEPKVTVMYIDRHLTGAYLLQTVARVNRTREDKEYGYIIDYYGVLQELDDALSTYSEYEEKDKEVFRETLAPISDKIAELPQKCADLWDMFKMIPNKRDLEAYAQSLRMEDRRHEFYDRLTAFSSVLQLALSTKEFFEHTEEKTIQRYKEDMRMFAKLRSAVQLRYSDAIDYKRYEAQIERLINRHVESDEVKVITKLVNIFDTEDFQKEVDSIVGTAAKADTIASRTAKYINENMESDPAFYKKFSQLIREAIEAYEQGRLSDNDYLERMLRYKEDVLNHTDSELPAELEHNNAAKAYYGIALETYKRLFPEQAFKEIALATANAFDNIIRNIVIVDDVVLVDWQSKSDIIGKMKIELEDELIDNVKRKYELDFSFDDMDIIIDGCVDVAKIWIR